ncbi:hypothetical protein [Polaromonas sp.]|uniref:hypothetical protein n=1 Tax=Polaromonas sp. TaxID=1869339 RepID=UPI003BAB146D
MILGLVILASVIVGLIVAFAAFVVFWIVMIVFRVSAVILAQLVGDPYLGFFLAFPVTGIVLWIYRKVSEKPSTP